MADLQAQLKKLFPEHECRDEPDPPRAEGLRIQSEPILCKYEKKGRGGKAVTLLEGYEAAPEAVKALARTIQSRLGVGGSVKGGSIIIQGKHREKIMEILKEMGFNTKRIGG